VGLGLNFFDLNCRLFADDRVERDPQSPQPASEVVGGNEVGEMSLELAVRIVAMAAHGRFFDRELAGLARRSACRHMGRIQRKWPGFKHDGILMTTSMPPSQASEFLCYST
jgi:hypothetical protein